MKKTTLIISLVYVFSFNSAPLRAHPEFDSEIDLASTPEDKFQENLMETFIKEILSDLTTVETKIKAAILLKNLFGGNDKDSKRSVEIFLQELDEAGVTKNFDREKILLEVLALSIELVPFYQLRTEVLRPIISHSIVRFLNSMKKEKYSSLAAYAHKKVCQKSLGRIISDVILAGGLHPTWASQVTALFFSPYLKLIQIRTNIRQAIDINEEIENNATSSINEMYQRAIALEENSLLPKVQTMQALLSMNLEGKIIEKLNSELRFSLSIRKFHGGGGNSIRGM